MKKLLWAISFLVLPLLLNSCSVIGDIFKTGIWVGVIVVIAIIAVIAFIFKMFSK